MGSAEIANDAVGADQLANTAVVAGAYTTANITVDAQGRIVLAANGSATVGDASVSQVKLKTSSGSVSTTNNNGEDLTLPGGAYGFYPQIKVATGGTGYWGYADSTIPTFWTARTGSTTYVTIMTLSVSIISTVYAQQTYVTSSGDIFWIFLLIDKSTGLVQSSFQSPEHVCFNNGGDPLLVPHPFGNYDPSKHEIVVVNPTVEQLAEMDGLCSSSGFGVPEKDILELFYHTKDKDGEITADPVYCLDNIEMEYPKRKTAIGVVGHNDRLIRPTIWRKGLLEQEHPVMKAVIPQPEYIKVRGIKKNAR